MKVLMLGRSDLFSAGGGDKVQIDNTADELRKLGIDVDIDVSSAKTDFSKYDIVHVFQLDWVLDTYFHINNAKRVGKPVVFSPIHHSVIITDSLFFEFSVMTFPRTINFPLPVLYNSTMSPETVPPVGKSGPVTISQSFSIVISGFLI